MAEWLWLFWVFSFLGWGLERCFAAVTHAPEQRRRGLLVAPLCPVYGLGMVAVLALPSHILSGWRLYGAGVIVTTAVEYVYHWLGERFFGVRFWDYSGVWGNLQGRVSLPFSLAWGVLTLPAVRLVAPAVRRLAMEMYPAVTWLFLMAFTADAVCSACYLAAVHDLAALRRAVWRA